MVVFSLVFILILQIKIGDETLEQKSMEMIRESKLIEPLQEVADGGVKVIEKGWGDFVKAFDGNFSGIFNTDNIPGKRKIGVKFERSKEYLENQLKQAKEKVSEYEKAQQEAVEPINDQIENSDNQEEEFEITD